MKKFSTPDKKTGMTSQKSFPELFEETFPGRKYSDLVPDGEQDRVFDGLCEPLFYASDGTTFILVGDTWKISDGTFRYYDRSPKGVYRMKINVDKETVLTRRQANKGYKLCDK